MVILAATRSMAMQGVKMRIPSIKFRHGRQTDNQPAMSSAPRAHEQTSTAPRSTTTSSPPVNNTLPNRFLRQPISEEEIEYINRGGPA